MGHYAAVNNIPLLASSPVQWSLRGGVRPVIMEYEMTPDFFGKFLSSLGQSNTVTLQITIDGGKTLTVRGLYFLGNSVGTNDYIRRIIIADRRWLWDRHAIYRQYNIRRHVGVKRLTAIDVPELQDTVPAVRYAKYSVKSVHGGTHGYAEIITKWTAKDVIEDIIKSMVDYEKKFNPDAQGFKLRGNFKKDIPIENLRLDDPAGMALNKALSFIGGADVYVDYDGQIIVYDKTSQTEQQAEINILNDFDTTKAFGFGNIEWLDKSYIRPKEIRVMFHREIEVRFDAVEGGPTIAMGKNKRFMENVIALPDWTLGGLVQGTWISLSEALYEWNRETLPLGGTAEFTFDYLRKAFVPFIDFWSPFLFNGVVSPRPDWASRVAAIMMHWRRTFRLNRDWIDRILHISASRVATIDPVTGQKAPAIAYANYSQIYTERSFYYDQAQGKSPSYYANYPVGLELDSVPIREMHRPAPARVSVVDSDQGIINLDFLGDPYRLREVSIPGLIGEPRRPFATITGDVSCARVNNVAFDAIGRGHDIPEITDGTPNKAHVTTVILTAISASPNDNRQYHVVVKKPSDLRELRRLGAKGPPMEVIIGSAIETARVRWLDKRKSDIQKLFGIGLDPIPRTDEEIELSELVDDLVINRGKDGAPVVSSASLDEIAKAVAYRVYLSLSDRLAGSAAQRLRDDITIRGFIDDISHEVNPDGVAVTRVSSPVEIPELDLFSILDENTRATIMKIAQVGREG